jgi:hypothetical protein
MLPTPFSINLHVVVNDELNISLVSGPISSAFLTFYSLMGLYISKTLN